jgi:hypothetical protein
LRNEKNSMIDMNKDNISALVMAIAAVSLIAGFAEKVLKLNTYDAIGKMYLIL